MNKYPFPDHAQDVKIAKDDAAADAEFTVVVYKDITANVQIMTHYRPAPPCNNPDSPSFSDPGSDCEFDIVNAWETGKNHDLTSEEIEKLYEDDGFYQAVIDTDESLQAEREAKYWEEQREQNEDYEDYENETESEDL